MIEEIKNNKKNEFSLKTYRTIDRSEFTMPKDVSMKFDENSEFYYSEYENKLDIEF